MLPGRIESSVNKEDVPVKQATTRHVSQVQTPSVGKWYNRGAGIKVRTDASAKEQLLFLASARNKYLLSFIETGYATCIHGKTYLLVRYPPQCPSKQVDLYQFVSVRVPRCRVMWSLAFIFSPPPGSSILAHGRPGKEKSGDTSLLDLCRP